jgi:hypothetical protein
LQPSDLSAEGHVCPFCGVTREYTDEFDPATPCPRCTLADTPTTRNATKARVGPWHVRQVRNPWAPGMRFETLLALIKRGQVTKDSIVRGPTTHQLWKRACEIKGLSREFGACHSCGGEISTQTSLCPHCNRLQEPPANPDMLVDVREAALRTQAPTQAQPTQQLPAPATSRSETAPNPTPMPARSNGSGNGHGHGHKHAEPAPAPTVEAHDEAPKIEIGSAADPAAMGDPDEMLSIEDPASAAALARQITSRPPARPRTTNLRPRTPGADDALLTPQELAAAFQLDFSNPAAPEKQPRGSKFAAIVLLLLLVGGGAAVLLYLRPDLREKVTTWSAQTTASVKSFVSSRTAPAKPPELNPPPFIPKAATTARSARLDPIVIDPAPPAGPKKSGVAVAEPDAPIVSPPAKAAAVPPAPAPKQMETPEPSKAEPAASKSASGAPSLPVVPATPAHAFEQPKPPVVDPPKPVVVTPPPAPAKPMSIAEAETEARKLWGLAFEAEQNQDYVEAVSCYEKIKKLPGDVHPLGLEVRLSLAKKLMK